MVARIVWDDLVSVQIRVPRPSLKFLKGGYRISVLPEISNLMRGVRLPLPAPLFRIRQTRLSYSNFLPFVNGENRG